jgi:hypothetical protein
MTLPDKKLQWVETAQHEYRRLQNGNPDELAVRRTVQNILQRYNAKRISELSEADCKPVICELRRALALHLATVSPIIPIPKYCKAAKLTDWPKLATRDPATIDKWLDNPRHDGCNWGSVTNAIDVDSKDPKEGKQRGTDAWAKLTAENGEPATLKTLTPSGGSHFYIADTIPKTSHAIGDGIDTVGSGAGYVVSPGSYVIANGKSIRATGFYKAVAGPIISVPWVVERLGSWRADPTVVERGLPAVVELDDDGAISQAIDLLTGYATSEREVGQNGKQINGPCIQGEGGDIWINQVANNVGDLGISQEMCSALMFEHFNPKCEPPWLGDAEEGDDKDRLSYKVASAYKSRLKPPGSDSAEAEFGADPLPDADDDLIVNTPKRQLPNALSLKELMEGDFPRTSYTVGDLVMQGVVNMFYGDGGTGKTTIAIQMGVAVASGRPLFERDTIKTPVLLVLAEDANGEIKPRVAGAIKDLELKDIPDNCEVWALPGEEISVARINEEGKTVLLPFYYELEKKLAATPGLFMVLDSLADIAQMGEAHRLPVNAFFKKVLGGLAVKYKATILVLGHPSKASMADGSYYSGSTAYRNAVRNMLVLKVIKGTSFRSLERLKNNYANPKERITVAWADDIFVTPQNAVIADSEQGRYRAVLNCIRDLITKGNNVANTNQASGQTPKDVANAVNALGVVTVTWQEVKDFMKQAERIRDLKYIEGTRTTKASYVIGDTSGDFEPGDDAEPVNEAQQEFADDIGL